MKTAILSLPRTETLRDPRYGSVRELAGMVTSLPQLGFAWVEVDPGAASPAHFHKRMSELYHITEGRGEMILDGLNQTVSPGDCISIAPGVAHSIKNTGTTALRFFCATSPSYDPEDDYEI